VPPLVAVPLDHQSARVGYAPGYISVAQTPSPRSFTHDVAISCCWTRRSSPMGTRGQAIGASLGLSSGITRSRPPVTALTCAEGYGGRSLSVAERSANRFPIDGRKISEPIPDGCSSCEGSD
jgi:hypothetical protein